MESVFVAMPAGNLRDSFLTEAVRKRMESCFEVTYNTETYQLSQETLGDLLKGYDAVITGWGSAMLDRQVLEGNDRLKLIVHTGGTVGNLVDSYVYEKGIRVFSGNLLYAESVAEGVLAYMLMGLRKLPDYVQQMRQGGWKTEQDRWEGLLERSVGIVGMSTISKILIGLLQPFRVKIKVFSHHQPDPEFMQKNHCQPASLEEIFETCDVVSVHSALNDQNRGLIQKKHFACLKDGALFINTSRGAVIDEMALIEELKKRRFRAVLDVYEKEPLPADSPLRTMENVYAIPHMAGPTVDRRSGIAMALVEQMQQFFQGQAEFSLEITQSAASRMTKM